MLLPDESTACCITASDAVSGQTAVMQWPNYTVNEEKDWKRGLKNKDLDLAYCIGAAICAVTGQTL